MTRWQPGLLPRPAQGKEDAIVSYGCLLFDRRPLVIALALSNPDALINPGYRFAAAVGPPADDAAEDHERAAVPDERGERVDEDMDGGRGRALPVVENDIDIGQAEGGYGYNAGRLIIEVLVVGATGVEIAKQLAVTPDL